MGLPDSDAAELESAGLGVMAGRLRFSYSLNNLKPLEFTPSTQQPSRFQTITMSNSFKNSW